MGHPTMPSACLSCFALDSGLLVYNRTYGEFVPPSIPALSSLSSVYDFLSSSSNILDSITTDEYTVLWRVYAERLKFLLIIQKDSSSRDFSSERAAKLCDSLFHCLVLQSGFDSIVTCPSLEILKQMILQAERLMEYVVSVYLSGSDASLSSHLDAVLVPHPLSSPKSTAFIDSFCRTFGANYALILQEDRVMTISTETSKLKAEEITLLRLFVDVDSNNQLVPSAPPEEALRSASPAVSIRSAPSNSGLSETRNSSDVFFLPHTSPNLAYRLFNIKFTNSDAALICLAGADFVMNLETRRRMEAFCLSDSSFLKRISLSSPLWFSEKVAQNLPKELYGVVIRNTELNVVFYSPVNEASSETRKNQRRRGLSDFIALVGELRKTESGPSNNLLPSLNEIYHYSGSFKFYFISRGTYELYCISDTAAPKQNLLSITEDILNVFTKQKNE